MKHRFNVGTIVNSSRGTEEYLKTVTLEGEELARRTVYDDPTSDLRGSEETLVRLDNGRLIVHLYSWSHWQGESSCYEITQVTEQDLGHGSRFEWLGQVAGFDKDLSLDDYLSAQIDGEI